MPDAEEGAGIGFVLEWEATEAAAVEDAVCVVSSIGCGRTAAEEAEKLSPATPVALAVVDTDAVAIGLADVSADGMAGPAARAAGQLKSAFNGVPSIDVLVGLDDGERLWGRVASSVAAVTATSSAAGLTEGVLSGCG